MFTMYSHVYRDIPFRSRVDHDAINVHVELLTVYIVLQRKGVCTTPTQKQKKQNKNTISATYQANQVDAKYS